MKKYLSLLLVISILFSLCSCSALGNTVISVGVLNNITTFDPVKAENDCEKAVAANCFEGLVRFNDDNNIKLANAVSYSIDKTGCIYTFELNPEAEYHISDVVEATLQSLKLDKFDNKITAKDYAYGIERYILEGGKGLSNIKNHKGYIDKDKKALPGVEADEEYILKITLEKPDPDFIYKLASLPIYPCNEAFYNALGEIYATTPGTVLTNGPYYVKKADELEAVLERCSDYTGLVSTENRYVKLYTTGNQALLKERFENGTYDMYLADRKTDFQADTKKTVCATAVWGIGFNAESPLGNMAALRKILMNAVEIKDFKLPSFGTALAERIIPDTFTLGEKNYIEGTPNKITRETDVEKAKNDLKKLLKKEKKKIFELTFGIPSELKDFGDAYADELTSALDSLVKITVMPYEYEKAEEYVNTGSYDFAIMPVSPSQPTALSLLNKFSEKPFLSKNEKLFKSLYERKTFDSDVNTAYQNAEKAIVDDNLFLPIFYSGNFLYHSNSTKGIFTADNGNLIYFHSASKDN